MLRPLTIHQNITHLTNADRPRSTFVTLCGKVVQRDNTTLWSVDFTPDYLNNPDAFGFKTGCDECVQLAAR